MSQRTSSADQMAGLTNISAPRAMKSAATARISRDASFARGIGVDRCTTCTHRSPVHLHSLCYRPCARVCQGLPIVGRGSKFGESWRNLRFRHHSSVVVRPRAGLKFVEFAKKQPNPPPPRDRRNKREHKISSAAHRFYPGLRNVRKDNIVCCRLTLARFALLFTATTWSRPTIGASCTITPRGHRSEVDPF